MHLHASNEYDIFNQFFKNTILVSSITEKHIARDNHSEKYLWQHADISNNKKNINKNILFIYFDYPGWGLLAH